MTNKILRPFKGAYQGIKSELNPDWKKEGPVTSLIKGITTAAQRGAQLPGGSWQSVAIAPRQDVNTDDHDSSDTTQTATVAKPDNKYAWDRKNNTLTLVNTSNNTTTVYLLQNSQWINKANNMRITDPKLISVLNAEHEKLTKGLTSENSLIHEEYLSFRNRVKKLVGGSALC